MNTQTIPATHYSFTDGQWSLLHNGQPLCAPTSWEAVQKVAARYGVKPSNQVWNGNYGKFVLYRSN